jgi:transcriptional regulator with XRE-family HTH domain
MNKMKKREGSRTEWICQNFGKAVLIRRKQLGFSQEEFADRAGITRTYVSDVERGARNVSLKNLIRFAEALDLPPSKLIAMAEERLED